jgi:hypothetical protein
MLLHFSLVISRLADQNKILAQQVGILHERINRLEGEPSLEGDDDARQDLTVAR